MDLNRSLCIFATLLICTWASSFFDQEWGTWKAKYDKKYSSTKEEQLRRKIWEDTWHKVQKHNARADRGLSKYWMGMNHFADITPGEVRRKSCLMTTGAEAVNAPTYSYGQRQGLPDHVDWRESKCVTDAKNQGLCGSCWAFATVGVVESRLCIKNKKLMTLSEQQLVDCDDKDGACCGGLPINALMYVAQNGVMKSEDYEYEAKAFAAVIVDGCQKDVRYLLKTVVFNDHDHYLRTSSTNIRRLFEQNACEFKEDKAIQLNVTKYYNLPDESSILSAVALEGPVTVGFAVHEDFMHYSHGIFDGECEESPNHAIIAVGYGAEEGEDGEKQPYWIVKNSWSEAWGENGFGKVQLGVDKCSISTFASSFDFLE